MPDPDELESEANRERERADAHAESEELLRRQAQEQRDDQAREDDAHKG